jgi:hypothetical protein
MVLQEESKTAIAVEEMIKDLSDNLFITLWIRKSNRLDGKLQST